ncbi:hypothetical protein LOZ12_002042 [Ophidiomyces ophidiicola]|uniref:Uncharacterized protein n=1 Tax=Ophidiomyces ophidiicola TaxID=1387563 RepID=A0ACB8UZH8_9EURO|nr:hypothetical protein LOZ61_004515 [Ophidiomyces ophidiicola]KAI1919048.1 hypothetical protein LOZ64_002419 [Ophidiomyces ophidiicola]KAI1924961.1 hypothetical protein LOZ60_004404 [Ophidiomyces ophidiicola]KAI1952168.1 hypothetical protein LOZ62_001480 [Ophidiomyces ophidiicola]KAI1960547.1 hypothetical protein LOZ59_002620 [Ophidiomyces ophidiicola]
MAKEEKSKLKQAIKKPLSWLSKSGPANNKAADQSKTLPVPTVDIQQSPSASGLWNPLFDRLQRRGVKINVDNIQPQDKSHLHSMLLEKIDSGMSGTEIGTFVVQQLQGKDQGLSNMFTQMIHHHFTYVEIALAAMELVGLANREDEFPGLPRGPILGGERRYYSRGFSPPAGGRSNSAGKSSSRGLTISERRGVGRAHIHLGGLRNPMTRQSTEVGHSKVRVQINKTTTTSFRAPSWPRQLMEDAEAGEAAQQITVASAIRQVQPETHCAEGEEYPPLLQPATMDRILRGLPNEGADIRPHPHEGEF